MNDLVSVFENDEFGKVRTVLKDEELWFVGKDVAEILGYKDTAYAISTHCKGVGEISLPSKGGNQTMKIISERDLYRLIMRSKLPNAEKFEEWVVGEVLPTIRKTGGYIQENRAIDFVNNWLPSLDEISKNAIASVLEENRKLIIKIKEDKPLVDFADTIIKTKDNISMNDMAKLLNSENIKIGRNKLFEFLRQQKILMKDNSPYQKYIENGWFSTTETVKKTPYRDILCIVTLVKPKGQVGIVEMIKSEYNVK